MIQVDIQKAYDMVDWKALEYVLKEVGFLRQYVHWIMVAVTSVSYRFNINGDYSDIMVAKRGLRQGDPISLLLFVLMMEYLNRDLKEMQAKPELTTMLSVSRIESQTCVLQMTRYFSQEEMLALSQQ